jgi:hypothetical protein
VPICLCFLVRRGGKDPRFDSTIGGKPFHQDEFAKRYKFLYDGVLPQEHADLKKQLRVRGLQHSSLQLQGLQQQQQPALVYSCT